jgi:squalene cyclase
MLAESLGDLSADAAPIEQQSSLDELLRRQNCDGGWSDAQDAPSEPAATGCVLESLTLSDDPRTNEAVNRGVRFLLATQQGDGRWHGSTSDNAIHATSAAIRGLLAAGTSPNDDAIAAGINWLVVEQQYDGGWQENTAESCASPTAWAVLAFVAAGKSNHKSCRRAVEFLIDAQQNRGEWSEVDFAIHDTAADCWVHNALHSTAWPLLALSRWAVAAIATQSAPTEESSLRLVGAASGE